jgi:hypothetical protein
MLALANFVCPRRERSNEHDQILWSTAVNASCKWTVVMMADRKIFHPFEKK